MTAKQRKTEQWAKSLEDIVGNNQASRKWRADNRRVDKRKRAQFRQARALGYQGLI